MDVGDGDNCPFVDLGHARCGDRFRLDSLDEALSNCFERAHTRCPAYAALRAEYGDVVPTPIPVIITVSCTHEIQRRLRPTGS